MKHITPSLFVIINMAADVARWKNILRQCEKYKIDCMRLEAVDASSWYNETSNDGWNTTVKNDLIARNVLSEMYRTAKPTVVAVHLSHIEACEKGFQRIPDAEWIAVFEDDIEISRDPTNIEVTSYHDIIHLHTRYKQHRVGREGYALTRRACDFMRNTLPLRSPGDIAIHKLKMLSHGMSSYTYVKELRNKFGSSKEFVHFGCTHVGVRLPIPKTNTKAWSFKKAKEFACSNYSFLYASYSQDGLDALYHTHCVKSWDLHKSYWVPRNVQKPQVNCRQSDSQRIEL